MRNIHFFSGASGWGAQVKGCEEGPEAILSAIKKNLSSTKQLLFDSIIEPKHRAKDSNKSLSEALDLLMDVNTRLCTRIKSLYSTHNFPIIFGGDHSIAIGTWNGIYQALQKNNNLPLGLIWIDAHMDSHTPQTSETGAWHGMPLATLLGYGHDQMLLHPKGIIRPENLCLIGIRSYECGEANLLRSLNITTYFIEEVLDRGIQNVLQEAVDRISAKTQSFGVSLDLDVIDPLHSPGVGSPEQGGIIPSDLLQALALLRDYPQLAALEIVEYNPLLDKDNKTLNIVLEVIQKFL